MTHGRERERGKPAPHVGPPGATRNLNDQLRATSRGEQLQAAAAAGGRAQGACGARRSYEREGPESGEDETGAEEPATTIARGAQPSLWTLRGVLAANAAMDKARRNEEWDAAPPVEARAAGNDAERAWLEGFVNTFKPHGARAEPARDRRVSGLTAPKRRRVTNKPETNKVGKAGLEASAESVVSNFVYAWVRAHFFLPAEHLCKEVRSALKEDGFECTEDDLDEWWEERGHSLVLSKAKSARHSLVDSVKAGVWLVHGAACSFRDMPR
jgi:hypothetical protein